ncbi:MAG: hypothetical protein HZA48_11960 [Planctomycetes bacterium]|nr:hypothetical protein [Planctomycetota bacterium]
MDDKETILSTISKTQKRLEEMDKERNALLQNLQTLQNKLCISASANDIPTQALVNSKSSP